MKADAYFKTHLYCIKKSNHSAEVVVFFYNGQCTKVIFVNSHTKKKKIQIDFILFNYRSQLDIIVI